MARLAKRNNDTKKPTKPIEEIKVGDIVTINNLQFQVCQIDELENKRCLVDRYACDYYVKHGEKVEIVNEL